MVAWPKSDTSRRASDEGHWVTGQTIEASGGYKL